ncbi:MAG: hypothetical protein ACI4A8_06590, partial [Muribaculaceae bacterium]
NQQYFLTISESTNFRTIHFGFMAISPTAIYSPLAGCFASFRCHYQGLSPLAVAVGGIQNGLVTACPNALAHFRALRVASKMGW